MASPAAIVGLPGRDLSKLLTYTLRSIYQLVRAALVRIAEKYPPPGVHTGDAASVARHLQGTAIITLADGLEGQPSILLEQVTYNLTSSE